MSKRDVAFLEALDLNTVAVSKIVNISRQTVSKKINSPEKDFFGVGILKKVYDYKCSEGADACSLATKAVDRYFDDIASIVIDRRQPSVSSAEELVGGECWFVCSDFAHFRGNYQKCFKILCDVAGSEATLALFVSSSDIRQAHHFKKKFAAHNGIIIVTCEKDLSLIPLLSRQNKNGGASVFVPSEQGFCRAVDYDAAKVHSILQDVFDDNSESSTGNWAAV